MFLAIINPVGFLPETEPVEFDSTNEAWQYLVEEVGSFWDMAEESGDLEDTNDYLGASTQLHLQNQNTVGVVIAGGWAYTVAEAE